MNIRSLLVSALVAGLGMAILSSIPYVAVVNCALCGWIWGGGIAAVGLYRWMDDGQGVTMGRAILTGFLAGVVGALAVIGIQQLFGATASLASTLRASPLQEYTGGFDSALYAAGFIAIIDLIIYPVFGLIGGAIGGAIFGKGKQRGDITDFPQ